MMTMGSARAPGRKFRCFDHAGRRGDDVGHGVEHSTGHAQHFRRHPFLPACGRLDPEGDRDTGLSLHPDRPEARLRRVRLGRFHRPGDVKLNPVGLKLLEVLMRKSPAVIRRSVLEEALWGDELPDSDSLRSHIHQLRQIVDKPFETPLIHTVHGVGYSLSEPAQ